jgi:alanyl-tRNA synthetase
VSLIATVNQAAQDRGLKANELLNSALPAVEGRGGGKADAAQGGGSHPEGLPDAFAAAEAFVRGLPD